MERGSELGWSGSLPPARCVLCALCVRSLQTCPGLPAACLALGSLNCTRPLSWTSSSLTAGGVLLSLTLPEAVFCTHVDTGPSFILSHLKSRGPGRLGQEDGKLKANLGNLVRPCPWSSFPGFSPQYPLKQEEKRNKSCLTAQGFLDRKDFPASLCLFL
ncbi:hypothetical protein H1C71_028550 [Ictidomys tridecemlineatus]|nr:hypothetical protein H1C71_028550 [Ictidomys tridecemlineatus]